MRIGGNKYLRERAGWVSTSERDRSDKDSRQVDQKPSPTYWEDIMIHGPYKVHSRRARVDHDPNKSQRGKNQTRKDATSEESPENSDEDHNLTGCITSADEYWTFGSSSEALPAGQESDQWDELEDHESGVSDDDEEFASDRHSLPDLTSNAAESGPDAALTTSPPEKLQKDDTITGSDADDEAFSASESDLESDEGFGQHQPRIIAAPTKLDCRHCSSRVWKNYGKDKVRTTFYRCSVCADFDICNACFEKGGWCEEKTHQLGKMGMLKKRLGTLSLVSRDASRTGIAIIVQRSSASDGWNSESGEKGHQDWGSTVFRYTSKATDNQSLLHASPPVMHPTLPLLVYALGGTKFLFANVEENTFFVHSIPYDEIESCYDKQCSTVGAHMRFSKCGCYLFIARATMTTSAGSPTGAGSDPKCSPSASDDWFESSPTTGRLFIQTLTVRLCHHNPCSGMPKTLPSRNGIGIGTWSYVSVQRLPYTLTWTENHVYVALATVDLMLRVIRISLQANADKMKAKEGDIKTLAKPFPLPRSARCRAIHFFPPAGSDPRSCTKIILGSTHGVNDQAQAPVVVYIRSEEIGEWVVAEDASHHKEHKRRRDPHMEAFDDSDCDLIMPLLDFQR